MFHTTKYPITFLICVHFDTSAIQIRKCNVSNPPWKSRFVTYMDVSVNLEITSVIHKFASYSSQNHYDILLTIRHHPIVNMDGIRSPIRFVYIHMCLWSFLKRYLTFKIIFEIPTSREFILILIYIYIYVIESWLLIYTVHLINKIYLWIYMQYIPRIMKTNTRLHHTIQYNTMECRRFGLSTFRCVDVLACRRFGLSTFWPVDVLVCRRFGLSTFWFVDVSVCRRFGLSTFWSVDVSVCRRFGLSTFRFVDVLVVDVSVCRRFDQLP